MQVIPGYLVYVVGTSMINSYIEKRCVVSITSIALVPVIGFTAIFVIMGLPSTSIGKMAFQYNGLMNQFCGVFIGLLGCHFIGALTFRLNKLTFYIGRILTGFAFGIALAFAYKPCVTPTLTQIYTISRSPDYLLDGGLLLFYYSVGVFTAVGAVTWVVAWFCAGITNESFRTVVKVVCGIFLLIFSFLILSGNMTIYKSLLVGGFVPAVLQGGL